MATDRKKFEDDDEIEVPKDKKKAGPAVDEEDDFAPGAKDAKKTHAVEVSEDDDYEFGDEKLLKQVTQLNMVDSVTVRRVAV